MAAGSDMPGAGSRVDRRRMLKTIALGAAGVGGAMAGLGGTAIAPALAASPEGTVSSLQRGAAPAIGPSVTLPPGTAGVTYMSIPGLLFSPGSSAYGYSYAYPGGITAAGASFFLAALSIPQGAVIRELMFVFQGSGAGSNLFALDAWRLDQTTPVYVGVASGSSNSTSLTELSCTVTPTAVDNVNWTYHLEWDASTNSHLFSARVGYTDPAPPFHPITPVRVYDSRGGAGAISAGTTRTIPVANSVTNILNVVAPGASAIAYNLTVTDTVGGGYLALFPYGSSWAGNSSINWSSSNETIANGGIVKLGGNRQVDVLCGGGSADFIIDVTGYYL